MAAEDPKPGKLEPEQIDLEQIEPDGAAVSPADAADDPADPVSEAEAQPPGQTSEQAADSILAVEAQFDDFESSFDSIEDLLAEDAAQADAAEEETGAPAPAGDTPVDEGSTEAEIIDPVEAFLSPESDSIEDQAEDPPPEADPSVETPTDADEPTTLPELDASLANGVDDVLEGVFEVSDDVLDGAFDEHATMEALSHDASEMQEAPAADEPAPDADVEDAEASAARETHPPPQGSDGSEDTRAAEGAATNSVRDEQKASAGDESPGSTVCGPNTQREPLPVSERSKTPRAGIAVRLLQLMNAPFRLVPASRRRFVELLIITLAIWAPLAWILALLRS